MTTPCVQEKTIDIIEKRTERMENKIDTLMEFRNRILGVQAAVSLISTGIVAFCAWIISLIIK